MRLASALVNDLVRRVLYLTRSDPNHNMFYSHNSYALVRNIVLVYVVDSVLYVSFCKGLESVNL